MLKQSLRDLNDTRSPYLKFHKGYFILFLVLFVVEVCIALFIRDRWIRPYVGDVLVVILIYCFVKSFFDFKVVLTAIGVLAFAFLVEFFQYLNIVEKLNLQDNRVASVVIGNSFGWGDLIAYTVGISLVVLGEQLKTTRTKRSFGDTRASVNRRTTRDF